MALGCILCQSPSIDAHVHVCVLFWAGGSCEDTRLESCAFARLCSPNSCANCSLLLVLVMALLHVLLKRGSFPRSSEPDPVRAGFLHFICGSYHRDGRASPTAPVLYQDRVNDSLT